jgi:chromate transporter
MQQKSSDTYSNRTGTVREVFMTFLKLGLTSFGGPIAHLGYFRHELVERRKWTSDNQFAQLLALCQFLPGPASSQLGFSMGLLRAGWGGALAAFIAFTLPSAIMLFGFAVLLPQITGTIGSAAIHGLKLVALAVVAHGLLGMTKQLCPDPPRMTIAAVAAMVILLSVQAWIQILVVVLGAVAGLAICRNVQPVPGGGLNLRYGSKLGYTLLILFFLLLIGLPLAARGGNNFFTVIEAFYRAGALVFGGGHVVLPLLEETVVKPGWISPDDFLAGYGAAQAVPGPMFTFAAYLGARLPDAGIITGASMTLIAIFLPGFLLLSGILPLWSAIADHPSAAQAIAGVNAAVVGLLGAALYNPVFVSVVHGPMDLAIAVAGFTMLTAWRLSALYVVLWCVLARGMGAWLF